jgi:hypothetical protein
MGTAPAPGSLPPQLTAFIGRKVELAELLKRSRRATWRLLDLR